MSTSKATPAKQSSSASPAQELKQLRQLIFGDAESKLVEHLGLLRKELRQEVSDLKVSLSAQLEQSKTESLKRFDELEDKLNTIDREHDQNGSSLKAELDTLRVEHDSLVTTSEAEFKSVDEALTNETQILSDTLDKKVSTLSKKLESVSTELSSSKTDRKTLAGLLATMATNLEDG